MSTPPSSNRVLETDARRTGGKRKRKRRGRGDDDAFDENHYDYSGADIGNGNNFNDPPWWFRFTADDDGGEGEDGYESWPWYLHCHARSPFVEAIALACFVAFTARRKQALAFAYFSARSVF